MIQEKRTRTFDQAIKAVFAQAHTEDMSQGMARLFDRVLESRPDREQVTGITASSLSKEYGKGVDWYIDNWWPVAVPLPVYEGRDIPSLVVETESWLVVSARVEPDWSDSSYYATIVTTWGKPAKTMLPLVFLYSVIENTVYKYRIVGKDGPWTIREVAGFKKPLLLNDEFIKELRAVLDTKPLADWLDDFGKRGRSICPLVVGAMLGIMNRGKSSSSPLEERLLDMDTLISAASSLGYSSARVSKGIEGAGMQLRPDMTNEEALKILLRYIE